MVLASFGCLAWMEREKRRGGIRTLFLAQRKAEKSTDREATTFSHRLCFFFFSFPKHKQWQRCHDVMVKKHRYCNTRGCVLWRTWKMRHSSNFFFSPAHFLSSSKLHLLKQASRLIISSMHAMLRLLNFLREWEKEKKRKNVVGTSGVVCVVLCVW